MDGTDDARDDDQPTVEETVENIDRQANAEKAFVQEHGGDRSDGRSIRERIRDADDVHFEDVTVEQWGVTVRIFSMSGSERADFLAPFAGDLESESSADRAARLREMTPALLLMTCFDPESGSHPRPEYRVFEEGDLSWLAEKNVEYLERVGAIAMRLAGLDREAKARAGKGSSTTRNGGSSST